ncbi:hypothetical protein L1987_36660 [Smallanthus sonchifolius]|uniref:Uncharacterized protein n=1 Tax=Smallanthus sonchifolius TaxID=185202 RepID=A0ACB9HFK2_9ASTR|nr:hypothetical protein L1987_36660 [Smallanthus sonchifolius]
MFLYTLARYIIASCTCLPSGYKCSPFSPFHANRLTLGFHATKIVGRRWSSCGANDGLDGGGAHGVTGLDGACNGGGHFSDSIYVPLFRQNQRR